MSNKKKGLLLLVFIGLGSILFYQENPSKYKKELRLTEALYPKKVMNINENKGHKTYSDDIEDEFDDLDRRLDEMESTWKKAIHRTFINEMKLSQQDFNDYLIMRDAYEDDRFDAYKQYHRKHFKDKDHYPITNENDANKEIKKEYQKLFKERYGDEAFARYVKVLDEVNSLWRKNSQDSEILTIDF